MGKKAIAYQQANGADKTYAEIQNPSGSFCDRDFYLSVIDLNGKYQAQGANPKMVGKTLIDLPLRSQPPRQSAGRRVSRPPAA